MGITVSRDDYRLRHDISNIMSRLVLSAEHGPPRFTPPHFLCFLDGEPPGGALCMALARRRFDLEQLPSIEAAAPSPDSDTRERVSFIEVS